jgi:BirA family transcriptional regulator, biotin operon repressor / biotin---[acetyl-CoA-carboxylase] ligase
VNIALLNRLKRASDFETRKVAGGADIPPPQPSPARGEGAGRTANSSCDPGLPPPSLVGEGRGGGGKAVPGSFEEGDNFPGPVTSPGGFIPLGSLGADLADLDELEAFGFTLERHPYHGVAYRGPSPRLCPDQIEWELGTERIGRRVMVWNRVSSTNDLAARASSSLANDGLVVLAEEQSSGRGRRGRTWTAPASSSILMSVLLFPSASLEDRGWLTALGAVAVAEVVAGSDGLDPRIKWPNDVRVGRRKLAGILVERGQGTVLGIGLNVNVEEFPEELRESATSLRKLLGRPLDRSEVARALIRRLDFHYAQALASGPDSLNDHYRERSEHLGHEVEVSTANEVILGRLADLDLRAGLTLELDDGSRRQVAGRDVASIINRD